MTHHTHTYIPSSALAARLREQTTAFGAALARVRAALAVTPGGAASSAAKLAAAFDAPASALPIASDVLDGPAR